MNGVLYFAVGSGIAPMLVVSMHSLRSYYDGIIGVVAGDDMGERLAQFLAKDETLAPIVVKRWNVNIGRGKGKKHAAKSHLIDQMPFDRSVFFDADTVIAGHFDALWPIDGYVYLTSFASWTSNTRPTSKRLARFKESHPRDYAVCMANSLPSINTGTMGLSKSAKAFSTEWSAACDADPCFQSDELVANLIYRRHPHNVLDCRYNWSPKCCGDRERKSFGKPVVYHLHGYRSRSWHPEAFDKKPQMRDLWLPYRNRAIKANVARMGEWYPDENALRRILFA